MSEHCQYYLFLTKDETVPYSETNFLTSVSLSFTASSFLYLISLLSSAFLELKIHAVKNLSGNVVNLSVYGTICPVLII